jgi:hypothetical protein
MSKEKERQSRDLSIPLASGTSEEYTPEKRNLDFSKIKIGLKTLEDAVLTNSGDLKKASPSLADKMNVLKAIDSYDYKAMREISDFFFKTNGIYSRLCKYAANLYRYDWMITPYINEGKVSNDKALTKFYDALTVLDNFNVKMFLGKAAMKVIRYGAYYGYKIPVDARHIVIQELPANYCRSRFEVNGHPAVEFNMKYFDEMFKDTAQRIKMVQLFPKEFQKGYILYKEGKLPAETMGDSAGWYLLDTNYAFAFNNSGEEIPLFISVIPYLIDLDQAQALDRKKMAQQLIKIVIQKMPLDKNGDLVFDVDEAIDLHNNAVQMLSKAIGVDVLTTFADVAVEDLADKSSVTSVDELEKVERSVYNASGTAQNLFNTDGNIALEKSIRNDEASLTNLILQFEAFLNFLLADINTSPKKFYFKAQILNTTVYNYQEMAKSFKDLAASSQCSRLLSPIALGQSQSSLLANAYFETQVLDLASLFIPPLTSNTVNAESLDKIKNKGSDSEDSKPGRKEKADDEKSEKTIANKESMN